jgi:hypothetical protein
MSSAVEDFVIVRSRNGEAVGVVTIYRNARGGMERLKCH